MFTVVVDDLRIFKVPANPMFSQIKNIDISLDSIYFLSTRHEAKMEQIILNTNCIPFAKHFTVSYSQGGSRAKG